MWASNSWIIGVMACVSQCMFARRQRSHVFVAQNIPTKTINQTSLMYVNELVVAIEWLTRWILCTDGVCSVSKQGDGSLCVMSDSLVLLTVFTFHWLISKDPAVSIGTELFWKLWRSVSNFCWFFVCWLLAFNEHAKVCVPFNGFQLGQNLIMFCRRTLVPVSISSTLWVCLRVCVCGRPKVNCLPATRALGNRNVCALFCFIVFWRGEALELMVNKQKTQQQDLFVFSIWTSFLKYESDVCLFAQTHPLALTGLW